MKVLVIAVHIDDAECLTGTMAQLIDKGAEVTYLNIKHYQHFKGNNPVVDAQSMRGAELIGAKKIILDYNIDKYYRSAVLENGEIVIEDDVALNNDGSVMFSYLVNKAPEEVGDDYFVLYGRKVSFDPSLGYKIEELDKTWPEVAGIHVSWETDVMRRITLTSKAPVKAKKYVMTIK